MAKPKVSKIIYTDFSGRAEVLDTSQHFLNQQFHQFDLPEPLTVNITRTGEVNYLAENTIEQIDLAESFMITNILETYFLNYLSRTSGLTWPVLYINRRK